MISVEEVLTKFEVLQNSGNKELYNQLREEVEFLLLEEGTSSVQAKQLKEIKKRLNEMREEQPQLVMTRQEIFENQRKMMNDCEESSLKTQQELFRQTEKLASSEKKLQILDWSLSSSRALILRMRLNQLKNKVVLKVALFTIAIVLTVILVLKFF